MARDCFVDIVFIDEAVYRRQLVLPVEAIVLDVSDFRPVAVNDEIKSVESKRRALNPVTSNPDSGSRGIPQAV